MFEINSKGQKYASHFLTRGDERERELPIKVKDTGKEGQIIHKSAPD